MAHHNIIYWHPDSKDEKGNTYANVHMLVGYCGTTITDFMKLADELRKTFPQAKDKEIHCGKVFNSDTVSGFTIITWSGYLPKEEYPGWHQQDDYETGLKYCW